MIDRPSLVRAATDRLAASEPAIGTPSPESRAQAIDAVAQAIIANARARRRRRIAWGALAVAASVGLVVSARAVGFGRATGVVAHGAGGVTLSHGGTTVPLHDGAELSRGDRVHVDKGASASLVLSTGTRVEVEGGSDLTLVAKDGDQVFGVESGATRFVVAKLPTGKRFVVRTEDAEVEVRGTVFRVAYGEPACEGTATRVTVTEGVVVVRRAGQEVEVPAGKSWPTGCGAPAVDPPAVALVPTAVSAVSTAPAIVHPAPKPTATSSAPLVKTPSSDLAEQNDVFAEATLKKRNGDRAGAVAAYGRLLTRWPGSALAETAAIERMRLLEGAGRRDAAKAYLARWPLGSARSEAEAVLAH